MASPNRRLQVRDLRIETRKISTLKPYLRNPRTHSKKQIHQIAASIREFGFNNPVLIDSENRVVAGHGRIEAAKLLGLKDVPTIVLGHLTEGQRRGFLIADNKIALNAGWDLEVLAIELQTLSEVDTSFELEVLGFDTAEIDLLIDGPERNPTDESDHVPGPQANAVSRPGDLWLLGGHKLLCGNALEFSSYSLLMGKERARMMFADPPYNVPIAGHVCGRGAIKHREFAMASGEMSHEEFVTFLTTTFAHAAEVSINGAIHFICMDWRHVEAALAAAKPVYSELKNICVWNKDNGGLGSFYRSKHEMVLVYKNGTAPHINTIELGRSGRYRTNVWDYAGVNTLRPGRLADLSRHPTTKPIALVVDAIKDCSRRDEIVLDPFGGSGTTLIASEKSHRQARLIEIDPSFVDVSIRRWQQLTGRNAVLAGTASSFREVECLRADEV